MSVVQTPTPTPCMHPLDKIHRRRPPKSWRSTTAMDFLVETSHWKSEKLSEPYICHSQEFLQIAAVLGAIPPQQKFLVSLSSAIRVILVPSEWQNHQVWMNSWQKSTQELSTTAMNFLLEVLPLRNRQTVHTIHTWIIPRSSCKLQSWTGWLFWPS